MDRSINKCEATDYQVRDSSDLSLSGNDAQVVPEAEATSCAHCHANDDNNDKSCGTESSVHIRQKSGGELG